ncbi:MAG: adenine deaminase [Prevotella sp.]|nr:adenine deaminase [Prevotella sp.]MBR3079342.1 adenine deaminase [Prevotella sp.]
MDYQGHIVDVVSREIFDGTLTVEDGKIAEIKRGGLPERERPYPYLMPGFIDSHVHIESSMMVPHEFARIAVSHGTIGVIADPHEIANVLGVEGVDYMIRSGRMAQFNFCFGAPSCVPALGGDVETNGATIDAEDIEKLTGRQDIGFLAEMMNYPGVLAGDGEIMRKIEAARRHGKPVDGHAPGLTGHQRDQYAAAGITTDHECSTLEEGRSCIKAGMKVIIREGGAARDYEQLSPLIAESPDMVMLCTDDCHPEDFVREHINAIVMRALADGYDLWDILQAACVNPQRHYHLDWGLLQQGDPATFIIVDTVGPHFKVQSTVIRGMEVYSYNSSSLAMYLQLTASDYKGDHQDYPNNFVAAPITEDDIFYNIKPGAAEHIINATDGSLVTGHEVWRMGASMFSDTHPWLEVEKIVVYNRYQRGAKPMVGLIHGFGITNGAIAGSVAHDCHNIVAVGSNDGYIVRAINRVIEMGGGLVVVSADEENDIPLPIAGLMAPLTGHELAFRSMIMRQKVHDIGCMMKDPFITMAFMALPVIPNLKLTDRHLMDTKNMEIIR